MGKAKTLKEAINKTYLVKGKNNGLSGYTSGILVLPKALVGERVKIVPLALDM